MLSYSPGQSDIVVERDAEEAARAHADLEVNAAHPTATKWVYIVMIFLFVALAVAVMATHAPSGG